MFGTVWTLFECCYNNATKFKQNFGIGVWYNINNVVCGYIVTNFTTYVWRNNMSCLGLFDNCWHIVTILQLHSNLTMFSVFDTIFIMLYLDLFIVLNFTTYVWCNNMSRLGLFEFCLNIVTILQLHSNTILGCCCARVVCFEYGSDIFLVLCICTNTSMMHSYKSLSLYGYSIIQSL